MIVRSRSLAFSVSVLIVLALAGCAGSKPAEDTTSRGQFSDAKKMFDKQDYTASALEFQRLAYLVRGTDLEDDVQFYLAETYFKQRQFVLAQDAYQTIIRNTPTSPLARTAYFQIAMCFYGMTPLYSLDQENGILAIQQFQLFIDAYPATDTALYELRFRETMDALRADSTLDAGKKSDSLKVINAALIDARSQYSFSDTLRLAEEKIKECRNKLARKTFAAAQQYVQIEAYKAATLYFDIVMNSYTDSEFFEPALLGKIDVLITRSRWSDARESIALYEERFPTKKETVAARKRQVDANAPQAVNLKP